MTQCLIPLLWLNLFILKGRDELLRNAYDSIYATTAESTTISDSYKHSKFFTPEISTKLFLLEIFEEEQIGRLRWIIQQKTAFRIYSR